MRSSKLADQIRGLWQLMTHFNQMAVLCKHSATLRRLNAADFCSMDLTSWLFLSLYDNEKNSDFTFGELKKQSWVKITHQKRNPQKTLISVIFLWLACCWMLDCLSILTKNLIEKEGGDSKFGKAQKPKWGVNFFLYSPPTWETKKKKNFKRKEFDLKHVRCWFKNSRLWFVSA